MFLRKASLWVSGFCVFVESLRRSIDLDLCSMQFWWFLFLSMSKMDFDEFSFCSRRSSATSNQSSSGTIPEDPLLFIDSVIHLDTHPIDRALELFQKIHCYFLIRLFI